jgi:hypothetical protein
MKSTKIMLAIIATLLSTWTLMSLIGYVLSDMSLRDCYTNVGTILCMMIFGWVPSVIVGCDIEEKLDKY